ncbi:hypothetical protein N9A28_01490 [Sulfurimonas sp.]|nr:hypothetical protein [Sulfurimonas sp.]
MIANILIIDKSVKHISTVESMIGELELILHVNIIRATTVEEAKAIGDANDIHLIIIDTDIGEEKFELVHYIRTHKSNTPNIPTMFITNEFNPQEYIDNNYSLGRIDYTIKPLEKYQFLNKVNLYLRHYTSKKELIDNESRIDLINSTVNNALETQLQDTVELIPLATAIVDKDSIIKVSNSSFREFSNSVVGGYLGNCFIENEEYVYDDGILDWKEVALNSEGQTKVLIRKYDIDVEYFVHIKKIEDQDEELYIVCFHPNDDI